MRTIDYNGHVPEEGTMTHDEIVAEIQARAERRGILTHYCQRAIRCVATHGMPDVFLVGPFGAAWLEVKTPGDHLDPGQTTWKYTLGAAGQEHYVVGPLDQVESGLVDALLDRPAGARGTRPRRPCSRCRTLHAGQSCWRWSTSW